MEPQFSNGPVPQSNRAIGTGEGESPLIPVTPQNVSVRTMDSDTSSIKTSGVGVPSAYTPKTEPAPATFTPPTMDVQGPIPTPTAPTSTPTQPPSSGESSSKGIVVAIVSFLVVLGIAAIGYFFLYPMFVEPTDNSSVVPPVAEVLDQAPEAAVPEAPAEPASTTPTSTASSTPTSTVPGSFLEAHASLFKTSADATSEISLSSVTPETYHAAITSGVAEVPVMKEVVFRTSNGILPSKVFFGAMAPKTFSSEVVTLFAPDFTFFTYTNASGTWPGFALKLSPGTTLETAKAAIRKGEANGDLSSIFLVDPGTPGTWKDGKFGTFSGRYLTYSLAGASLNYGWNGDTLIVSTNYAGAQEAAKRIGL